MIKINELVSIIAFVCILAACSNQEPNGGDDAAQEEVTLRVSTFSDEVLFEDRFKEPIEKAYSNITLEHFPVGFGDLEEAIAQRDFPDIILLDNAHTIPWMDDLEILMPLDELAEKHSTDLSAFNTVALERTRSYDANRELKALPFGNAYALYYNKDIFDLFGEPYPEDDMTWEEIIDLAGRVSGERNGIQYRGFHFDLLVFAHKQLGLSVTDPETGQILFTEQDEWADFFSLVERIVSDPALFPEGRDHFVAWGEGFFQDQTVAMYPTFEAFWVLEENPGLNFDVVTMPVWPDLPGVAPYQTGWAVGVTSTTEHPDEAFQVIEYLTYDEEYNLENFRQGIPTALEFEQYNDQFAADVEGAGDLNVEAFFDT